VERDGLGNIVGQKSYRYDLGNKLLQEVANGVTTVYQYDPNGNTISKTTGSSQVRYYWDDEDKMVRLEDSVVMNFKVDGLGFRRMKEVVGQGQTWFVYDMGSSETPGLTPLVAEYDGNGNLVAKYHYDGGGLIAMTRNNQSYWYGFEAIGTVRQLVNAQSQVTDAYAFDAWGNELTNPQSQVPNPFRYVGKHGYYLDTESALMLLGMRYYSAANGLFLSRDLVEGYDYIYTANNPVRWIDPQGLQRQPPRQRQICSDEELRRLTRQYHQICDRPRACSGAMSCDELLQRAEINVHCALERLRTAVRCFDPPFTGPRDTHLEQILNALQTALRCLEIYERNCLPPPPCPRRNPSPVTNPTPVIIGGGVAIGSICYWIARTIICIPLAVAAAP